MYNTENRQLVQIIREICQEQNISLQEFSESWILKLTKENKSTFVFGYRFENNSATTMAICNDKVATYMLLEDSNVPCIEHFFFMRNKKYKLKQIYQQILPLLEQHKIIVVKNNNGTGGRLIYKVSTKRTLIKALKKILVHSKFIAVSPFYKLDKEYRTIVCNGKVELIYEKIIPAVVGDGVHTIKELTNSLPYKIKLNKSVEKSYIPALQEVVQLNWKHNLHWGATANVDIDTSTQRTLTKLALVAAKTLKAKFVSVDIDLHNNTYKVLEVNSGIMMEKFATFNEDNYKKAKEIYTKAILTNLK
jgi:glutathione synthase/RimK-type ligase-like ATP-grasp enzyme